jgi:hypothetical protein
MLHAEWCCPRAGRWGGGCRAAGPRCAQAVEQSGGEPVNGRLARSCRRLRPVAVLRRAAPCRADGGQSSWRGPLQECAHMLPPGRTDRPPQEYVFRGWLVQQWYATRRARRFPVHAPLMDYTVATHRPTVRADQRAHGPQRDGIARAAPNHQSKPPGRRRAIHGFSTTLLQNYVLLIQNYVLLISGS